MLQSKLLSLFSDFGGDFRAQKINQILRVPGTVWNKKHEGCAVFDTKVLKYSGKRYTLPAVAKALDTVPTQTKKVKSESFRRDLPESFPAKTDASLEDRISLADFLKEVENILRFKGHKFMAKQAGVFYENLMNQVAHSGNK